MQKNWNPILETCLFDNKKHMVNGKSTIYSSKLADNSYFEEKQYHAAFKPQQNNDNFMSLFSDKLSAAQLAKYAEKTKILVLGQQFAYSTISIENYILHFEKLVTLANKNFVFF